MNEYKETICDFLVERLDGLRRDCVNVDDDCIVYIVLGHLDARSVLLVLSETTSDGLIKGFRLL